MSQTDDEAKLLEILGKDDLEEVEEGETELTEEQRAILSKILQGQMQSPAGMFDGIRELIALAVRLARILPLFLWINRMSH